ncbi:hypothetical protein MXD59_26125, partial [Frankia sp. Ag45/Mut15]
AGRLPFSWSEVQLHATGATTLRVRLTPQEDDVVSLLAADVAGRTVVSVGALTLRPVPAGARGRGGGGPPPPPPAPGAGRLRP